MDSDTEELHFQKLQELIHDDDEIVTVCSLAKDLDVTVQIAKKLINKYVEDHRKLKPDELAVTYILTGQLKNNKGKGVIIVKEYDLEDSRDLFESPPNELVYSVQKCKKVDFNIIALVDRLDATNLRDKALLGSIVSANCVKRTLKFKNLPPPPAPTLKGKSSFFMPKSVKLEEKQPVKAERKPGGIADLFNNVSVTKTTKSIANNSSIIKDNKATIKPNCALSGFLTKTPQKNEVGLKSDTQIVKNETQAVKNDNEKENGIKNCDMKQEEIVELMDVNFEEDDVKSVEKKSKTAKKETKAANKEKKNSKRGREKSEEKPVKKRKRIVERNDSESDDMFEKEQEIEDIIENSDDEPGRRSPSPIGKKPLAPKNKRRKAVDKTYTDEEGYIVTKTEYVYETASDDESDQPQKVTKLEDESKPMPLEKKSTSNSENEVSPKGAKGKKGKKGVPPKNQPTLMNFFKKK